MDPQSIIKLLSETKRQMKKFNLQDITRPNIWSLQPYSSARDEFTGSEGIFLDANENPYGDNNRYPDPHQRVLKQKLVELKGNDIKPENIFIGNGSDEVIDLVYRIFCEPSVDKVIICPPTYGMYKVSANINNVGIISIPLTDNFQLNIDDILSQQDAKAVFICSPNNPTGNNLNEIEHLLLNFNGLVVVDEAYIDFSTEESFINKLNKYPNLLVMQTFSKAWGLASARVGVAYASTDIIKLMNKTKPPYNVSAPNQAKAIEALSKYDDYKKQLETILEQRDYLKEELSKLSIVKTIYPSDSNFLLVEVNNATDTYNSLVNKNIVTRNRTTQINNCIRITVGTPDENQELLKELRKIN